MAGPSPCPVPFAPPLPPLPPPVGEVEDGDERTSATDGVAAQRPPNGNDTDMVDVDPAHSSVPSLSNGNGTHQSSPPSFSNSSTASTSTTNEVAAAAAVDTTEFMPVQSDDSLAFPSSSLFASGTTPPQGHVTHDDGKFTEADLSSFVGPSSVTGHPSSMFQADALGSTPLADLSDPTCPSRDPFESKHSSNGLAASSADAPYHPHPHNSYDTTQPSQLSDPTLPHVYPSRDSVGTQEVSNGASSNPSTSALTPAPLNAPSSTSTSAFASKASSASLSSAESVTADTGSMSRDAPREGHVPPVLLPINRDQAHVFGVRPQVVKEKNAMLPGITHCVYFVTVRCLRQVIDFTAPLFCSRLAHNVPWRLAGKAHYDRSIARLIGINCVCLACAQVARQNNEIVPGTVFFWSFALRVAASAIKASFCIDHQIYCSP